MIAAGYEEYSQYKSVILPNLDIVRVLMAHGADPNSSDSRGVTAFMVLAWKSAYFERYVKQHRMKSTDDPLSAFELIVGHGAKTEAKDSRGYTALFGAEPRYALVLLAHGANVNARGGGGETPLTCAAFNGNIDYCKFLIEHGAYTELKDNCGKKPVDYANEMMERGENFRQAYVFLRAHTSP